MNANRPTPQQVRNWMQQRQATRAPLPDLAEIRRQLAQSANCAR